jgi:DNA-binding MarR family transcriptional regulator
MDDVEGYWLSVSELARQRGVDKAAISRRAKRYEAQGLLTPRAGKGGVKMINVAEFDRAAGEATDAVRALNGAGGGAQATQVAAVPGDPILAREQARRASYDADLKKLELQERLGELVPAKDVQEAIVALSENFVRALDQMPSRAEEGFAEATKGGVAGFRAFLRALANGVRDTLERDLEALVVGAKQAEAEPP